MTKGDIINLLDLRPIWPIEEFQTTIWIGLHKYVGYLLGIVCDIRIKRVEFGQMATVVPKEYKKTNYFAWIRVLFQLNRERMVFIMRDA